MRILHVVGARPNYMKISPIMAEMARYPERFSQCCVHTGQHYDNQMSRVFFEDLEMPEPDFFLQVGSGSHADQTARIMLAFEPVVLEWQPDWVVVVGDVNSTLACALVCAKLGVPVAHVEAGLRSRDRSMPEEINRLVTDQLSDLLLTPSRDGNANLLQEGIPAEKIHFVGNIMIDSLVRMLPKLAQRTILADLGLRPEEYLLVTLHRPVNVDQSETLSKMMAALLQLSQGLPVVFPVHPRTRARLAEIGFDAGRSALHLIDPLGYSDFLALLKSARLVLTDSGGVQEESTFLRVPCLTARPNTERPVTVTEGTNQLIASTPQAILAAVSEELDRLTPRLARIPELWDGKTAQRIVEIIGR